MPAVGCFATFALAASFLRLAGTLLFSFLLLLVGIGCGCLHRYQAEHRLQRRIFLLAALTVILLDVLGFLLGYVDAIPVIPLLAGIASAKRKNEIVLANNIDSNCFNNLHHKPGRVR